MRNAESVIVTGADHFFTKQLDAVEETMRVVGRRADRLVSVSDNRCMQALSPALPQESQSLDRPYAVPREEMAGERPDHVPSMALRIVFA